MIDKSAAVSEFYPDAKFGYLVVNGLQEDSDRAIMDTIVSGEIEQLRAVYPEYERKKMLETKPLCHYGAYYKKFKKTYHVLGQLESILLKDKSIPSVGPAVEAMFLAEVKHLLLTAGHDLDTFEGSLVIDVANEPFTYQGISKKEQSLMLEDMHLSDQTGVVSSIIKGPDFRTRITKNTQNGLYFIYGVPGVTEEQIGEELQTIAAYLSQVIPRVTVQDIKVF